MVQVLVVKEKEDVIFFVVHVMEAVVIIVILKI